jgi:hypothetical protein
MFSLSIQLRAISLAGILGSLMGFGKLQVGFNKPQVLSEVNQTRGVDEFLCGLHLQRLFPFPSFIPRHNAFFFSTTSGVASPLIQLSFARMTIAVSGVKSCSDVMCCVFVSKLDQLTREN